MNKSKPVSLKEENQFLKSLVDRVPALMAYIDRTETYLYANETYSLWFKLLPSEIIGRNVLSVIGPKFYALVKPKLDEAFSGEHVEFEARIAYATGTREVRAIYVPYFDPVTREVLGITVSVSDLSLAPFPKDVSRTVKTAHDIRSPLASLKLTAQLISQRNDDPASMLRYAANIISSVDKSERILQNALDLEKIDRGEKLQLSVSEDLESVSMINLATLYRISVPGRFVSEHGSVIEGFWDKRAISRLFELIFSLADRESSPGKTIDLSAEAMDSSHRIRVKYHREHEIAEETKLLLALKIAEAHGGSIRKISENDHEIIEIVLPKDSRSVHLK